MKDYVIYFLTLVLGVAIFYIFNSMDSQQAMMQMSESKQQIMGLMTQVLGGVSVFISFVLGFLIVYANNFLIKRRKKEFGLYMLLGMGKGKISKILLLETLLVGIFSLAIGLVIGIFASQLMSILVSKMFEANMSNYQFIFSQDALIKTLVYFAIIYLCVMMINVFATSKYKLIDLITAKNKNEKIKIKNPIFSVILFILSIGILGCAYYLAITKITEEDFMPILIAIGLGCIGTFLFFYSLSGFMLKIIQTRKKIYQKDLNMFVLRQIDSKINTTVFSMSVICILLFLTICIFSSAMSINNSLTTQLKTYTPVDATFTKRVNIAEGEKKPYTGTYNKEEAEASKISIKDTLIQAGIDVDQDFSEMISTYVYTTKELKQTDSFKPIEEIIKSKYPALDLNNSEPIMKLSDYNKIAPLYGNQTLTLNDNEFIVICNYDELKNLRNEALQKGLTIELNGKTYVAKFTECQNGFYSNSAQPMEAGTYILPDNALPEEWKTIEYFHVNYQGSTPEEKEKIEQKLVSLSDGSGAVNEISLSNLNALTRMSLYDASKGLAATVTFIGLYLGIVFLISSSAILALKELSESSDNKERYKILRKIGADEKMINKALFKQIGIFYLIPLALATAHSIFGIKVCSIILAMFGKQDLVASIAITAGFIVLIYGAYFLATYYGSKAIIKEE